jgi:hypothetical protein
MSIKAGEFGRRPWMRTLFRWFVTAAAVFAFAQAALAGAYLGGHYDALGLHGVNAMIALVAAFGATVLGVLVWKPGGGAWWPAAVSAGVFLAENAQTGLGYARLTAVHIPLGVAIIAGLLVLTLRAWRPAAAAPPAEPVPADDLVDAR